MFYHITYKLADVGSVYFSCIISFRVQSKSNMLIECEIMKNNVNLAMWFTFSNLAEGNIAFNTIFFLKKGGA